MRVALLSLLEPAEGEPSSPRGYLRIGGQLTARHQLALALALGCNRIVFLAEALSGELVALQHVAEDRGAQFHVIAAGRALAGLVSPEDELLVLSEGLVAMPGEALELLGDGPAVLTLPVETGIAAGFERIDINHASAGAMRLPGKLAARLADLPGDWSAPSALLRAALQTGIRQVGVPGALLDDGRWVLLRSEAEAHAAEPRWLRLHTAQGRRRSPGESLVAGLVHRFGPAILHAGTRPFALAVAAWAVGFLALGSAWFGYAATGFVMLGVAWMVRCAASLLERIERDSLVLPRGWFRPEEVFAWALDAAFVVAVSWRSAVAAGDGASAIQLLFAPVMLFGLLRLLPGTIVSSDWPNWLTDRLIAGVSLAVASAFTGFEDLVMGVALALLAGALFYPAIPQRNAPNPALTKTG